MYDKDYSWTLPGAYLKVFLQHAAGMSLPLESVLRNTDIHPEQLSGEEQGVSFSQLLRVLENVNRALGHGWHLALAERLTVPAHGPLGFAVVTAADIRGAVDVLVRFLGIRGPFLWPAGAVEDEYFVIRFFEAMDMGDQRRLMVELALLSVQHLLTRPLGRGLQGAQIAFALAPPHYREALESAFQAGVTFNARRHSLRIPAAWLDEPCALHDPAMHRYLVARCEEELRLLAGGLPAELAVRHALLARPGHMPTLKEVAAGQNLSPRTLMRRLKKGDTSFRKIRDGVRRTLASDYLANSDIGINRIAYRLGYQDPSNFGRAFRGWFGVSPGHFRARHRARAGGNPPLNGSRA